MMISSSNKGSITIHGIEYPLTGWELEFSSGTPPSPSYIQAPPTWGGRVEFIVGAIPNDPISTHLVKLVLKTGTGEYRGKALITSCDLNTSDSKNFSITAGFEGQEELESTDEPDLAKSGFLTALEVEWDEELLAKDSKESLPNPQEVWYNKLPLWAQRIRNLELD